MPPRRGPVLVAAAGGGGPKGRQLGRALLIALMALSALDAGSFLLPPSRTGAWCASLNCSRPVRRAGRRLCDRLLAVSDRLATAGGARPRARADRERARREEEIAHLDRRHRAQARERIARLVEGRGLDIALQPIVALDSGGVVGAEALARFTDDDGEPLATEETFVDAHALDLGVELELAVVELALTRQDRLPEDLYLACNVSPAVLTRPELAACSRPRPPARRELNEHHRSRTTPARCGARPPATHGVPWRDDVGSGFASFPHVTREAESSARRTLCSASTRTVRHRSPLPSSPSPATWCHFVSECIDRRASSRLVDLAFGCGQGFLLAGRSSDRSEPRFAHWPRA